MPQNRDLEAFLSRIRSGHLDGLGMFYDWLAEQPDRFGKEAIQLQRDKKGERQTGRRVISPV